MIDWETVAADLGDSCDNLYAMFASVKGNVKFPGEIDGENIAVELVNTINSLSQLIKDLGYESMLEH